MAGVGRRNAPTGTMGEGMGHAWDSRTRNGKCTVPVRWGRGGGRERGEEGGEEGGRRSETRDAT